MRIVFMATGEIAEASFAAALESEHEIIGLVTQPDRPVGRKQQLQAPRVKTMALEAGIPVIQPEKVRDEEALSQIQEWNPEVIVVMAYGQILPPVLIEIPSKAIINLHASLLPKYRGASCVQGPIREGDAKTGWSVIHVDKKLDAGNVILQQELEIGIHETGGELHDRLALLAPLALRKALALFGDGEVKGEPQIDQASTYVPKLHREDGKIDWTEPAEKIERMIRAYDPWPGTFTIVSGRRLKIFPPVSLSDGTGRPGSVLEHDLEIACGKGSLILSLVQPEGKARMDAGDYLRGYQEQIAAGFE